MKIEWDGSGLKTLRNLSLVGVILFVVFYLLESLFILGSSPCNLLSRMKGSECVRVIRRDANLHATNVYFVDNGTSIAYVNGTGIEYVSLGKGSQQPVFIPLSKSLLPKKIEFGEEWRIEGFALNSTEDAASICVAYYGGKVSRDLMYLVDFPSGTRVDEVDPSVGYYCGFLMSFKPGEDIIVLTEYNTEATVAFIDPYQENRRQIRGSHASFSGDGNHFAVRTLSMDSVSIFTFPDLREIKKVELPARMSEMQMSADGKMIFVSDFERPNIYQVDVDTGNVIHTFSIESHQRDEVNTIAISPDGTKLVASVSEIMGKESDITIWNLSDKTIIKSWHFAGWSLRPMSMTFSPDGNLLAIGTNNYVIVLDVSN